MKRLVALMVVLAAAIPAAGCVNANSMAMQLGKPPEGAVNLRALQSRRFETTDEKAVLAASTQTLQDLGFTIAESSSDVGVVTASKQRDARETGQVAGQVMLMVAMALTGSHYNPTWDQEQTIQVTLVASLIANSNSTEVRTVFDRILTNNHGVQWRAELIMDPPIYQEFYERLSKSIFLEAHEI
jgi:hypothetical protein